MIGRNLISTGVLPSVYEGVSSGGGDLNNDDIVLEPFVYDGANNQFNLADAALKVMMVFIDNGTYPTLVPNGAVNSITIPAALLFNGNKVAIQYIKA